MSDKRTRVEFIESYWKDGNTDYIWNDNHGELIRCKDCKYFKTYPPTEDQDYTIYDCERLNYCTDNAVGNLPDDFCSKGERKDEAEE